MVKSRPLLIAALTTLIVVTFVGTVAAQVRQYHLEHEWAKIWINPDGTIDLLYDIDMTLDSGSDINRIFVGQPNGDFTIGTAMDQYGSLTTSDASVGSDYKVRVDLRSPLTSGHSTRFNLTTNVANMIYEDDLNPGNLGMQFIPTWWTDASVRRLNVSIVLPSGVTVDKVKTPVHWNGTVIEPDGRLSVYWERSNLLLDQRYTFGVSFPKEFLPNWVKPPPVQPPSGEPQPWPPPIGTPTTFIPVAAIFFVIVFIIGAVVAVARKLPYAVPSLSMETLGISRGLTAVEASYLLDVKPTRIVTEILYSLLQKRAIWVESTAPSLKLKIMQTFQDKTGAPQASLRYYEIDFLRAIKTDGTLDERKLAQTYMSLRDTVEQKMRGYCRRDTIDYYRKIVDKAWQQVEQAGTPELASKAYDEQLLWLFLDPNYKERTQVAFRERVFDPNPLWWWYWYGYRHYYPNPVYTPKIETPLQKVEAPTQAAQAQIPVSISKVPPTPATQEAKPPAIPGADFANNMVTAVEKTSNNIVASLEKFAAAIIPMQAPAAKASHAPAHHASGCVCACAACACACACVSCACACAGGGVG